MEKENFNYYRHYNTQTGQREMLFYHPEIDYRKYINDLPQLDEMDNRKLVEMGISFDQSYTLEQVKTMLPSNVHPVWYWVDTYSDKDRLFDKDPMPESANMIYGFGPGIDNGNVNEEYFLSSIENGLSVKGKYYNEYKRIYDYLRKEKEKPVKNDVKILGVVVTGTAENLKTLKEKNYIKSATLGVVTDKY